MINQTSYERFGRGLYASAEYVVFSILGLAYFLNEKAIDSPESIYNYQSDYNSKIEGIANTFDDDWKQWAGTSLAYAYIAGLQQAGTQLKDLGLNISITNEINSNVGTTLLRKGFVGGGIGGIPPETIKLFDKYPEHLSLYNAFRKAVEDTLQNQKFQIIRKSNDIFRDIAVMTGNTNYREADIFTRRKFSQQLLDEYAKKGIQTVTYKNGSRYSIDSYCEMLGRTMTGRAAVQSTLNRFYESGYTLVTVSSHFRACHLCTPYEGVTLSIERHPQYESIADAELQGLFHCNCAHDVSIFQEDKEKEIPRVASGEQQLIDKYGYDDAQVIAYTAQQQQRYFERNIRNWKRRNQVSLDARTKDYTNKKIRYWQKRQRELLKNNTFLPRKYSRESINIAN